jgi:hypothetical protein
MWNYDSAYHEMSEELKDCRQVLPTCNLWLDIDVHGTTVQEYRVDTDTDNLTESDMRKHAREVFASDGKEVRSFITHNVFIPERRSGRSAKELNLVDAIWVRKFKRDKLSRVIKSRMVARGCFDRQKHYIEKHSSTATRLSQRIVVSSVFQGDLLYSERSDRADVDIESLDISTAFLQGLDYQELAQHARSLGYENTQDRTVAVQPPENIWTHFRDMARNGEVIDKGFLIQDHERADHILVCRKALYGFTDAPLMFQLALTSFLTAECNLQPSLFDANYLFRTRTVHGQVTLDLIVTAHVDDLQISGCQAVRDELHWKLEQRFGKLKRQRTPYIHAGIELERVNFNVIRLHQDSYTEKLKPIELTAERAKQIESEVTPEELHRFRSVICAALWAGQTRCEELCAITSMQQKLKSATVKDLLEANTLIKRLKRKGEKFGIWFVRMHGKIRVCTVSDASAANKTSNFATEGCCVCLMEDNVDTVVADSQDFISERDSPAHGGIAHLLHCSSTKSKRVSHSTSHAESLACARLIPVGQLTALRLSEHSLAASEPTGKLTPLRCLEILDSLQLRTEKMIMTHDHFVDCMDLWELACGQRGVPQDKSQRLAILAVREERRSQRLRRLYHITTHYMLADLLTKCSGYFSKSLQELVTSGHWSIGGKLRVRHLFGKPSSSSADPSKDDGTFAS